MTIIGSCGHELADTDGQDGLGFPVMYQSETCDAIEGFQRSITYANVCAACKEQYRDWGILFETEGEAHAWLEAGS